MKLIKLSNAEQGQNSEKCKTLEYSFGDKDIDLGIGMITGRFPDEGYAMNLVSKELIYVIDGSATMHFENETIEMEKGDAVLIQPKDKYYFETEFCKISMSCTPAWSPKQHKMVK